MKKYLQITIRHPEISLELRNEQKMIDQAKWQDGNDTSLKLLSEIDRLLEKNRLRIQEIEKMTLSSDQSSYTASRIARTVAKTINFCLGELSDK